MSKYIVGSLLIITLIAALLLYVGESATLTITSAGAPGIFNFGEIAIGWRGAIIVLIIAIMILLFVWSLLSWLMSLPERFKSGLGMRRRVQALEAMEEALIAGAEGDVSRARKRSEKARSLIRSKALGHMISAQAAETSGDNMEAINQYTALLEDERTEPIGRRGLANQYLSSGNMAEAINHAGQEYNENKHAHWAFDILFQAQLSEYNWKDARQTLEQALSRKHIDKDIAKRRMAVLDTALATDLEDNGLLDEAIDMAKRAISSAPGFAPAAVLLARLLGQNDETRKAISVLEKAWEYKPHPALSAAFLDLLQDEDADKRRKKVTRFVKKNPEDRESLLLEISEDLRMGDAVKAWSSLSTLVKETEPSARLCLLAAQAETLLANERDAKVWAIRSATAAIEPDWSDLDPEGEAFDYTPKDWRRLIYSYGEKGELIHPRFECGAPRLSLSQMDKNIQPRTSGDDVKPADDSAQIRRQPDDPGVAPDMDSDDIAARLDSLLDGKKD